MRLLGRRPVPEEPVCQVDRRRHTRLDASWSDTVPQGVLHILTDPGTTEQGRVLQGNNRRLSPTEVSTVDWFSHTSPGKSWILPGFARPWNVRENQFGHRKTRKSKLEVLERRVLENEDPGWLMNFLGVQNNVCVALAWNTTMSL